MVYLENSDRENWVDENNVVLGFDNQSSCCENFGHLYASDKLGVNELKTPDISAYRFDPDFFEDLDVADGEDGGKVVFRLIEENLPDIFLILYNYHNGYYSHGFSMNVGGKTIHNGSI